MTYLVAQKQSQALSGSYFIQRIRSQALSLMGIVFGFLLVAHPEKFSGVSQVHPEKFSEVSQTTQDPMPRGVFERKGARIVISWNF